MKRPLFFIMLLAFMFPSLLLAEEPAQKVLQKIVLLNGARSSLMEGDADFVSGENKALPRLLKEGWVIAKLSNGGDVGYALLEKNVLGQETLSSGPVDEKKEVPFLVRASKGGDLTLAGQPIYVHQIVAKLKELNVPTEHKIELKVEAQCPHSVLVSLQKTLREAGYNNHNLTNP